MLMAENFPKLTRDMETPTEGVSQIPAGKEIYIYTQHSKTINQSEEKNLKSSQRKKWISAFKEQQIRPMAAFLEEMVEAIDDRMSYLKQNNYQTSIWYPMKIAFKNNHNWQT